jgi:UrcA family protein
MRTKTYMLLLSFVAATASSVATADALVNVKSEVVRYDDIRLISTVGAAVLYGRLHNAAERACGGPLAGPPQLAHQQRYRTCMSESLTKAVDEVNHPILTQYYESKRKAAASPASATDKSVTASTTTR